MTTIQRVIPVFRSFDETKAREFYVDYLGFSVSFEHRLDQDSPLYLGLTMKHHNTDNNNIAADILHLSEHHGDACPGSTVRLEIDDIEAFHKRLSQKKYRNARPNIVHQPWGQREVSVTDPFGNRLVFCQPDQSILDQRANG